MKQLLRVFVPVIILLISTSLIAEVPHTLDNKPVEGLLNANGLYSKNQIVYVCMGEYAYAYHSRSNCPGINNCKGVIKYTNEYDAINVLGRAACCRCWSNVSTNCKDDNPSYKGTSGGSGGGGGSDAAGYLALAVIAGSAVVLSNDIYFYPTHSFYNSHSNESSSMQTSNGIGWIFGFRKTLQHSAFEYGASYLKVENKTSFRRSSYSTYDTRWGAHLNFVQQLFYNKTPKWLKAYVGPSVNYISDFGYGGIVGAEMKLVGRLKFDVRYEYTTQTNQVQAGLIFNYQKRYFWEK